MAVLGLRVHPSHFVAFMPKELEDKLYDLEKVFLEKHHKGHSEDDILETRFKINVRRGKYEPQVIDLKVK
jgi:hypothetical protein